MLKYLILIFSIALGNLYAQNLESISKKEYKKDLIKFNGSLSLGTWFYNATGIQARKNPISWYVSGAPTVSFAGMSFPFSATISEQDRSFQQPFNQFGVSPYYKWIKLHLGYRNMSFSEYTLAGATFLGAGIELNPKKFRIGAFYGRLRRAVDQDTTVEFTVLPSFKRMAWGAKIGYGTVNNYVDLSVLKSKDIMGSAKIDSFAAIKPQDNFVVALKNQWRLFKALTFGGEGALSIITYNKWLGEIKLDSSLGNDAAKFSAINNLITFNLSTKARFAGNGFINFQQEKYGIQFSSRYTQSEFISHGANYVQDDIFINTLSPSVVLFKGRVNVGTSVGIQQDNLDKTKQATTKRLVSSANVSFKPIKRSMVAVSYSNYGTTQSSGNIQLNDSVLMSIVNTTYGLSASYQFPTKNYTQAFSGNIQKSDVLDRNEFTKGFSQSSVLFTGVNYNLGVNKIKANFSTGLIYSLVNTYGGNIKSNGINLSVSKNFLKNAIRISTSFGYQERYFNNKKNGYIATNNTNFNYNYKKKHNFGLGFNITKNTSSVRSIRAFNEQRIRFNYGFNF